MTEHASEVTRAARLQLASGKLAQVIDIGADQAFHTEDDVRNLAGVSARATIDGCLCAPSFSSLAKVTYSGRRLDVCWRPGGFFFTVRPR